MKTGRGFSFFIYSIGFSSGSLILANGNHALAGGFTTINYPGATSTEINGIQGNDLVGVYTDSSNAQHGFLYNGTSFMPLDVPTAMGSDTNATGISEGNIVGFYTDSSGAYQGFFYNGSNYASLNDPSASNTINQGTQIRGIQGSNMVGFYLAGDAQEGFLYNGATWQTIATPSSLVAAALGIDGSQIVGFYADSSVVLHGMINNGTSYSTLDDPNDETIAGLGTELFAVQGNDIVGRYDNSAGWHAFFYNGENFIAIDPPGSISASATGIDGDTVVGYYTDSDDVVHGFETTVPEPSMPAILTLAAVSLLGIRRRRV